MASAGVKLAEKPEPKFGYRSEPKTDVQRMRILVTVDTREVTVALKELSEAIDEVQRAYDALRLAAQDPRPEYCADCQTPEVCLAAGCSLN